MVRNESIREQTNELSVQEDRLRWLGQSWSWVGSIHGLGWVGLGQKLFNFWWVGLVGLGADLTA